MVERNDPYGRDPLVILIPYISKISKTFLPESIPMK